MLPWLSFSLELGPIFVGTNIMCYNVAMDLFEYVILSLKVGKAQVTFKLYSPNRRRK